MGSRSQADARAARKRLKAEEQGWSSAEAGARGQSIIEMLEERLYETAGQWVEAKAEADAVRENPEMADFDIAGRTVRYRGELRGLAISIAMMRHPLKRYETAWWNYVKKLEKRSVSNARDRAVQKAREGTLDS